MSRRQRQHRLQQHRRSQPAAHLSKPQRKPQRQLLQHAPQLSPQKPRRYLQKHRRHHRKQIHFFRNTIPHSKPTWTTAPLRTPVPNSTPYSRMRGQTAAGCGEAVMTIWLPWGQAGWKAAAVSGLPLRWKTAANLPFGWAISKQTSTQTKRTAIAAAKAVQMFWNSL